MGGRAESVRASTYPKAGAKQPARRPDRRDGRVRLRRDGQHHPAQGRHHRPDAGLGRGGRPRVGDRGGKTTSFVYDADGDRLIRKTPTDSTLYIDDMELRLDHAKNVVECTRYYTIGGEPVAVRTPDNEVYFLAADHQGTAQAAVKASTGEVAVRRSTPFGQDRACHAVVARPAPLRRRHAGHLHRPRASRRPRVRRQERAVPVRRPDHRRGRSAAAQRLRLRQQQPGDHERPRRAALLGRGHRRGQDRGAHRGQAALAAAARRAAIAAARSGPPSPRPRGRRPRSWPSAGPSPRPRRSPPSWPRRRRPSWPSGRRRRRPRRRRRRSSRRPASRRASAGPPSAPVRRRRPRGGTGRTRSGHRAGARPANRRRRPAVTGRAPPDQPQGGPTAVAAQGRPGTRTARTGYNNSGQAQPTRSVTVYRNGKMYPDGHPPGSIPRGNGSGQGQGQNYKFEEIELEEEDGHDSHHRGQRRPLVRQERARRRFRLLLRPAPPNQRGATGHRAGSIF